MSDTLMVSRAALHMWEEPCISGKEGSGTVFFSGCNMHCIFCQNYEISGNGSHLGKSAPDSTKSSMSTICGKQISTERLADIFLSLESKGANNINLVTPTHFVPSVAEALILSKDRGLNIPVVYNTSGYELPETLAVLDGLIDVYLPDFKYMRSETALNFSKCPDYPDFAKGAIKEMFRQTCEPVFEDNGLIKKGVIVRHLILPGHTNEAKEIISYLYDTYGDSVYLSLMSQFTPIGENLDKCASYPELSRKVSKREYEKVVTFALEKGVKNGFTQEGKAALESFIPSFMDCEGV